MMINKELRESLECGVVVFDNPSFDNSIIGFSADDRVIYDFDLMVRELMADNNWNEVEAIEFIEFNTLRALPYIGENAPIVMVRRVENE